MIYNRIAYILSLMAPIVTAHHMGEWSSCMTNPYGCDAELGLACSPKMMNVYDFPKIERICIQDDFCSEQYNKNVYKNVIA